MNPLRWKRELQVALILAATIGVPLGIILGHITTGGTTWELWSRAPNDYNWPPFYWMKTYWGPLTFFWWGLFGASVGAGIVYLIELLRSN
jgi:hypothetical protein